MLLGLLIQPDGSLEEQVGASVDTTLATYIRERTPARSPHRRAWGTGRQ
jgi:hypothetical protein